MHPALLPIERIEKRIFIIRGRKVMLDRDLAELYGVPTKVLNQAVRRNIERFPDDFMFILSEAELINWRSQFVTSNVGRGGLRYSPAAFTEQGVAMLSSVLKSERAILVNLQIIRTFTKLREMISENETLRRKLETLEQQYDEQFKTVFDALHRILAEDDQPKREIGFKG